MFSGVDITHDERRILQADRTFSWQETWYPVRMLHGIDAGNEDMAIRLSAGEKRPAFI